MVKFKVTERKENSMCIIVRAESKDPVRRVALFIDKGERKILYPVRAESVISGMSVVLDSYDTSACHLPPVIYGEMVEKIMAELGEFHDVIEDIRRLINEEMERIGVRS